VLQTVKDYLKITWADEDAAIQGIIGRGQAYLEHLTGTDLDFDTEGQPRALLLDYCRYAYSNALEYFEENFRPQLLRLQLLEGVKAQVVLP
jgi:hypothetical protein